MISQHLGDLVKQLVTCAASWILAHALQDDLILLRREGVLSIAIAFVLYCHRIAVLLSLQEVLKLLLLLLKIHLLLWERLVIIQRLSGILILLCLLLLWLLLLLQQVLQGRILAQLMICLLNVVVGVPIKTDVKLNTLFQAIVDETHFVQVKHGLRKCRQDENSLRMRCLDGPAIVHYQFGDFVPPELIHWDEKCHILEDWPTPNRLLVGKS